MVEQETRIMIFKAHTREPCVRCSATNTNTPTANDANASAKEKHWEEKCWQWTETINSNTPAERCDMKLVFSVMTGILYLLFYLFIYSRCKFDFVATIACIAISISLATSPSRSELLLPFPLDDVNISFWSFDCQFSGMEDKVEMRKSEAFASKLPSVRQQYVTARIAAKECPCGFQEISRFADEDFW